MRRVPFHFCLLCLVMDQAVTHLYVVHDVLRISCEPHALPLTSVVPGCLPGLDVFVVVYGVVLINNCHILSLVC